MIRTTFFCFAKKAISGNLAASALISSSSEMANHLKNLIATKATTNDLYTLEDMSTTRMWNYELPTLTKKSRFVARQPWNSSEEFKEAFFNKFPIFKDIDLTNIAIAGGAIFDLLHSREDVVTDIDIFIVGDLPEETSASGAPLTIEERVIKRAERFIDDLYKHVGLLVERERVKEELAAATRMAAASRIKSVVSPSYFEASRISHSAYINLMKATRNGSVITFTIPNTDVPIQLILCPHRSVPDLLREVDLDCTAVAFVEGKDLVFNPMSKFCFENGCTVVTDIRGSTFEERIAKYFSEKGVDVILPQLDVTAVSRRNLKYEVEEVIDLKTMGIIFSEIIGDGKIITTRLVRIQEEETTPENERESKDPSKSSVLQQSSSDGSYGSSEGGSDDKKIKIAGTIIHENIIHLVHGLPKRFQFYGEGKYLKDVLLPIPKLTHRMIANSYETVRDKLEASLKKGSEVPVTTLERYFTVKPTSQILSEILVTPLLERENARKKSDAKNNDDDKASGKCPAVKSPTTGNSVQRALVPTLFDARYAHSVSKYLDELVEAQVKLTQEALAALEADFAAQPDKYRVVTDKPFVRLDMKDWYGNKSLKK